jgi:hypothetical protein
MLSAFQNYINKLLTFFLVYPIIIPAIVAEINDAIVPPIKAFIPNFDNVFLCPGAKDPIPPIWIPIDAKFANPHNIYVAIIIDLLYVRCVAFDTSFKSAS